MMGGWVAGLLSNRCEEKMGGIYFAYRPINAVLFCRFFVHSSTCNINKIQKLNYFT